MGLIFLIVIPGEKIEIKSEEMDSEEKEFVLSEILETQEDVEMQTSSTENGNLNLT